MPDRQTNYEKQYLFPSEKCAKNQNNSSITDIPLELTIHLFLSILKETGFRDS